MNRSNAFRPGQEPFHGNHAFAIDPSETRGPVHVLAPTQATFAYSGSSEAGPTQRQRSYGTLTTQSQDEDDTQTDARRIRGGHRPSNVDYKWTSRNTRKGRHALLVGERSMAHDVDYATPEATDGLKPTLRGLWRMLTKFPWDDLSFLTAVSFVSGCVLLVVNASLSVLPLLDPGIQLSRKAVIAQACLTFIGCTLFLTSSLLSWLEAVNANREGCFGWSTEQTVHGSSDYNEGMALGITTRLVPDESCSSHYDYRVPEKRPEQCCASDGSAIQQNKGDKPTGLRLFPTLHELRTDYIYDLGFGACSTLFLSSVIYWITALASLVVAILKVETAPWIRALQLIAALGFAVASAIFALETQDHWAVPALTVLGWHVGFWNFVGSCGFALFAVLTLAADESSKISSSVHYFWGCWGFLIGSAIQWYESLAKHPVQRKEQST